MSNTVLNTSLTLIHLILIIINEVEQYPHLTDEDTQVQNGEETPNLLVSNKFR